MITHTCHIFTANSQAPTVHVPGQHQPDAVSCSAIISSYDQGSQWQAAIRF